MHTLKKTMMLISKAHKTQKRIRHSYTVKNLNDFDLTSRVHKTCTYSKKTTLLISQMHKTCIYDKIVFDVKSAQAHTQKSMILMSKVHKTCKN